jgi:hypothetical protein
MDPTILQEWYFIGAYRETTKKIILGIHPLWPVESSVMLFCLLGTRRTNRQYRDQRILASSITQWRYLERQLRRRLHPFFDHKSRFAFIPTHPICLLKIADTRTIHHV